MTSHLGFLRLPREIRDIVYHYYVLEDDGYHFDYDSGKLRASGRPVDLALMYTNRLVNAEMQGLALGNNTITFSTVSSESERLKMGRWHWLLIELTQRRNLLYASAGPLNPDFQSFNFPEAISEKLQRYPGDLGEPGSVRREELLRSLEIFSEHPDFIDALAQQCGPDGETFIRCPFLLSSFEPWTIPSEDEVALLDRYLTIIREDFEPKDFWKRVRYRWSAATVAISFLKSISPTTRVQIRSILLDEDHESVAYPETHGLGLISFCLENSRLHVERRLSLWRNVFPSKSIRLYNMVHDSKARTRNDLHRIDNLL
ncbi:hypothetical protein MMC10_007089 [Thelotrema lepadinum]|nr:hypothetical protein [Thelotrema lepadinum]